MLQSKLSPWPSFSPEEVEIVGKVLQSNQVNYWTGEQGRLFEEEFAEYIGVKHAIALANGTLALELALRSLDIGPGDEVIVTPRSFMASASCVVHVGAQPAFSDVDLNSGNLSAELIADLITPNTKAIICVHLAGLPCDMDPIMALADKHGLFVIEDCAQAHGAEYKGQKVGSIGHIGAFSFCQDKIMTTGGEGGMLTTNNTSIWNKAWSFKDHGKSWSAVFETDHPNGFKWLHETFGSNYRMTEMQAAIGRYQLTQISSWLNRRSALVSKLNSAASQFESLRIPVLGDDVKVAPYKHNIYVKPEFLKDGETRDTIRDAFRHVGVPCFSGSCPEIYLEKAFDGASFKPKERLPNAKLLGETNLCFLVHPTITDEQMDWVCNELSKIMSEASKK